MCILQMKVPGVREASLEYACEPAHGKWAPGFIASCPVPHDWMLDPAKLVGVPPEMVARWQRGLARVRAEQGEELDEAAAQAALDARRQQAQERARVREHEKEGGVAL